MVKCKIKPWKYIWSDIKQFVFVIGIVALLTLFVVAVFGVAIGWATGRVSATEHVLWHVVMVPYILFVLHYWLCEGEE